MTSHPICGETRFWRANNDDTEVSADPKWSVFISSIPPNTHQIYILWLIERDSNWLVIQSRYRFAILIPCTWHWEMVTMCKVVTQFCRDNLSTEFGYERKWNSFCGRAYNRHWPQWSFSEPWMKVTLGGKMPCSGYEAEHADSTPRRLNERVVLRCDGKEVSEDGRISGWLDQLGLDPNSLIFFLRYFEFAVIT